MAVVFDKRDCEAAITEWETGVIYAPRAGLTAYQIVPERGVGLAGRTSKSSNKVRAA